MNDAVARNFEYLAYGLITIWAVLAAYVLSIASRERKLRAQIDGLKRMLEERK
jgi:hypothetical protein